MKNIISKLSTPKKLASLALLLGVFALIIGNSNDRNKISVNAREVALSTVNDQDKINVITLADWLIKGNADYTLIDLRTEKEFSEYSIPTAVNIKMEEILNSNLMRNQKLLLYGIDDIAKIVMTIKDIDKKSLSFIALLSKIPKENFLCYTTTQSTPQHWNF